MIDWIGSPSVVSRSWRPRPWRSVCALRSALLSSSRGCSPRVGEVSCGDGSNRCRRHPLAATNEPGWDHQLAWIDRSERGASFAQLSQQLREASGKHGFDRGRQIRV